MTPTEAEPEARTDDPGWPTIALPETRRSGRSERRAAGRRRRRRTRRLVAGGAAALIILGVGVRFIQPSGSDRHRPVAAVAPAPAARAGVAPVVLAQRDAAGRAVSLLVLAPAADGRGGSVILLPPGTMTEVVALGLEPVTRSLELGGAARLQSTLSNLLGVPLAEADVFDDAGLAALVNPAGPLTVDIPSRVEEVARDGTVRVLYQPGPTKVAPADIGRLLSARGSGDALARLARHQAFVEAWLARLHASPAALPAAPAGLRAALSALAAGPVRTRVLPVHSLGTAPDVGEIYKVDQGELAALLPEAIPGARVGGGRPSVQILNGTGAIGLDQHVADLLGTRVDVKLTGNASGFGFAETQIVFYDAAHQGDAQRIRDTLGVGRVVLSRNPLDVVDVTIVAGKDIK